MALWTSEYKRLFHFFFILTCFLFQEVHFDAYVILWLDFVHCIKNKLCQRKLVNTYLLGIWKLWEQKSTWWKMKGENGNAISNVLWLMVNLCIVCSALHAYENMNMNIKMWKEGWKVAVGVIYYFRVIGRRGSCASLYGTAGKEQVFLDWRLFTYFAWWWSSILIEHLSSFFLQSKYFALQ